MGFGHRLLTESEHWVEEGIISPRARDELLRRYPITAPAVMAATLLGSIAALLVGAGLIAVIAFNWDFFPSWLRLVWAVLPLGTTWGLIMWWARGGGGRHRMVLQEVSLVLNGLSMVLALALIAQIYHIQGSAFWLLIMAGGALAPLVIIIGSLAGGLLAVSLLFLAFLLGGWNEPFAALGLAGWLVVPFLGWIRATRKGSTSHSLWWLGVPSCTLAFLIAASPHLDNGLWLVNIALLGGILGLLAAAVPGKYLGAGDQGQELAIPALVLGIITFLVMGFQTTWNGMLPGDGTAAWLAWEALEPGWTIWLVAGLGATFVLGLVLMFHQRTWLPLGAPGLLTALFWAGWALSNGTMPPLVPAIASNLLVAAQGTVWMLDKRKHPAKVIGGSILVLGVINQRFFDGDFSLLLKGFMFIGSGLILWWIYHQRFVARRRPWS